MRKDLDEAVALLTQGSLQSIREHPSTSFIADITLTSGRSESFCFFTEGAAVWVTSPTSARSELRHFISVVSNLHCASSTWYTAHSTTSHEEPQFLVPAVHWWQSRSLWCRASLRNLVSRQMDRIRTGLIRTVPTCSRGTPQQKTPCSTENGCPAMGQI